MFFPGSYIFSQGVHNHVGCTNVYTPLLFNMLNNEYAPPLKRKKNIHKHVRQHQKISGLPSRYMLPLVKMQKYSILWTVLSEPCKIKQCLLTVSVWVCNIAEEYVLNNVSTSEHHLNVILILVASNRRNFWLQEICFNIQFHHTWHAML